MSDEITSHGLNGNGRHPAGRDEPRSVNPYVDAVTGEQPSEIVDFEMSSDPYRNMVPTISAIHAARSLQPAVKVGGHRSPLAVALGLIVVAAIVLPFVLALISYLTH
ncbi:MAG: hypothetical protein JOZ41_05230 [Chloroflexi bacterium]|nr:hypothetical protein [Chloroflexota bacterium]